MATGNYLPPFSEIYEEKEDFENYVERFELFLLAHDVDIGATATATRLTAMFLHALGPKYYGIVKDLVSPDTPRSKSYMELKEVLSSHLRKPTITVAERRKFIRRNQQVGESLMDYVIALKHLSLHCGYGRDLDMHLRDRFISGLNNEAVPLKLINLSHDRPALKFSEAVEFAHTREESYRQAHEIRSDESTEPTNKVEYGNKKSFKNKFSISKKNCSDTDVLRTILQSVGLKKKTVTNVGRRDT